MKLVDKLRKRIKYIDNVIYFLELLVKWINF